MASGKSGRGRTAAAEWTEYEPARYLVIQAIKSKRSADAARYACAGYSRTSQLLVQVSNLIVDCPGSSGWIFTPYLLPGNEFTALDVTGFLSWRHLAATAKVGWQSDPIRSNAT